MAFKFFSCGAFLNPHPPPLGRGEINSVPMPPRIAKETNICVTLSSFEVMRRIIIVNTWYPKSQNLSQEVAIRLRNCTSEKITWLPIKWFNPNITHSQYSQWVCMDRMSIFRSECFAVLKCDHHHRPAKVYTPPNFFWGCFGCWKADEEFLPSLP